MRFPLKNIVFYFLYIVHCAFYVSCTDKPKQKPIEVNYNKLKEDIIEVNKPAVVMENDEINAYIKAHNYTMQITGTGLRYMFIKENVKEKKIESGNLAEAEEAVMWYKRVFGDDYYIELQRHKTDKPNADY